MITNPNQDNQSNVHNFLLKYENGKTCSGNKVDNCYNDQSIFNVNSVSYYICNDYESLCNGSGVEYSCGISMNKKCIGVDKLALHPIYNRKHNNIYKIMNGLNTLQFSKPTYYKQSLPETGDTHIHNDYNIDMPMEKPNDNWLYPRKNIP